MKLAAAGDRLPDRRRPSGHKDRRDSGEPVVDDLAKPTAPPKDDEPPEDDVTTRTPRQYSGGGPGPGAGASLSRPLARPLRGPLRLRLPRPDVDALRRGSQAGAAADDLNRHTWLARKRHMRQWFKDYREPEKQGR